MKSLPSARRKHRLTIDVTYSHTLTHRRAAHALQMILDQRLDLASKPVWPTNDEIYCEKLVVSERRSRPGRKILPPGTYTIHIGGGGRITRINRKVK